MRGPVDQVTYKWVAACGETESSFGLYKHIATFSVGEADGVCNYKIGEKSTGNRTVLLDKGEVGLESSL